MPDYGMMMYPVMMMPDPYMGIPDPMMEDDEVSQIEPYGGPRQCRREFERGFRQGYRRGLRDCRRRPGGRY